ncbi:MAG: replication factor C small subunit, partial [Candidatus Hodarchaeales archaeon]
MWTEEFRPRKLADVVGQQEIVKRLAQFVRRSDFPHMLFSGPPGVGKTTCA